MKTEPEDRERCFYCDTLLAKNEAQQDHFPIPKECGGTETVPCCWPCHDMKDRFPVGHWPVEWTRNLRRDMEGMSREGRLLMAKLLRIAFVAMDLAKKRGQTCTQSDT